MVFQLSALAREWLLAGDGCDEPDSSRGALEGFVLRKMARGEILDVGGILVDRAIFATRFACVPERCSPANHERGRMRSCCADLAAWVSPAERRRLGRQRVLLLEKAGQDAAERGTVARGRRPFWLDEGGAALSRPGGRCVFSTLGKEARIRCRLHGLCRTAKLPRVELQPLVCRLFPLALIALDSGQVLVTVLQRANYRLLGSFSQARFPCLADPSLPPLLDAMAGTLDSLFGRGFARALRRFAD